MELSLAGYFLGGMHSKEKDKSGSRSGQPVAGSPQFLAVRGAVCFAQNSQGVERLQKSAAKRLTTLVVVVSLLMVRYFLIVSDRAEVHSRV